MKTNEEELNKSIDDLIDDLFADEEEVEKSMMKDLKQAKTTADSGEAPPKGQDDDSRGAGRPKQISDVPKKDEDGRRQSEYDDSISEENKDGKTKEQDQVKPSKEMVKKSESDEDKVEISKEDFAAFQAFKKSEAEKAEAEVLQKAKAEQSDLIKSAVVEATADIRKENEELRKSLQESSELIKSIANRPQSRKAVTSVKAVERFEKSDGQGAKTLSKAELLDVAEELVKSGDLTTEHVIELEQTGYIFEDSARQALERKVKRS